MTDKEIEAKARELCRAAGENPDRRLQEYRRTCWSYPAWEDFRAAAVASASHERNVAEVLTTAAAAR